MSGAAGGDCLLVSRSPGETRIALVERDRVAEVIVARDGAPVADSIHLGRVVATMPETGAVLVDIGAERPGFLALDNARHGRASPPRDGEAVLVAVGHEPRWGKGAKLTTAVTLAAREVVYSPFRPGVAVSRRVGDDAERARLTALGRAIASPGEGIVVRSAAVGADEAILAGAVAELRRQWAEVERLRDGARAPACLHPGDDPLAESLARPGIGSVRCDDADLLPRLRRLFDGTVTLGVDSAAIDAAIEDALLPDVRLSGGGSLRIALTPAVVAIDVDSGGTAPMAVNIAAAAEIARQIRLRNLSGHMVVDFIPSRRTAERLAVVEALRKAVASDPISVHVTGPSPFGLVELVRERRRAPLAEVVLSDCRVCAGSGSEASIATAALAALRTVLRESSARRVAHLGLGAAPDVVAALQGPLRGALAETERRLGHRLSLKSQPSWPRHRHEVD